MTAFDLRGLAPIHVAYEVEPVWLDDVIGALAAAATGDDAPARGALERWWKRRDARHAADTTTLETEGKAELAEWLAGEPLLADLATSAPRIVRRAALMRLRQRAHAVAELGELGAPAEVLATEKTRVAAELAALDPGSAWEGDPVPEVEEVPLAGGAVLDLHDWLAWMIAAGCGHTKQIGLRQRFTETPGAERFTSRDGQARVEPVAGAPGLGASAYLQLPDDELWCGPAIALPGRLAIPGTPPRVVVVDGAGGPVTYARHGDAPGPSLDPRFAKRVAALGADRALISFVWLEDEHVVAPWDQL